MGKIALLVGPVDHSATSLLQLLLPSPPLLVDPARNPAFIVEPQVLIKSDVPVNVVATTFAQSHQLRRRLLYGGIPRHVRRRKDCL